MLFQYFTSPLITDVCHGEDQATTTLHETTHAPAVFSPPTDDFGYGYNDTQSMSSDLRVLNADTYALYANGMFMLTLPCHLLLTCGSYLQQLLELCMHLRQAFGG